RMGIPATDPTRREPRISNLVDPFYMRHEAAGCQRYDRPAALPGVLAAAALAPGPRETVLEEDEVGEVEEKEAEGDGRQEGGVALRCDESPGAARGHPDRAGEPDDEGVQAEVGHGSLLRWPQS